MAGVRLEKVGKTYGETRVLSGLDLDVADGEFLVLGGPSGCGKSTALRLIAGLDEPTEGTISIGGKAVNGVPPRERDIAMVFQSYALYPHMTVRENLRFGLEMRKVPPAEAEARLTDAAEYLGLAAYLDRRPRQLSGGQRQRVALARALVTRPAVFLFDEPLSNLDAALRVSMRAELARLQERYGTTSIYDARPGRGHDARPPHRGLYGGLSAGRRAARRVPRSREPVRRGLPQDAGDQPAQARVAEAARASRATASSCRCRRRSPARPAPWRDAASSWA